MSILLNPQLELGKKDLFETPLEKGDLYGPDNELHSLVNSLIEQIQYTDERHPFFNLVRQIESGGGWGPKTVEYPFGNPEAESKSKYGAGARGVYQFKDKDARNKKGEVVNAVKVARGRAKQLKSIFPGILDSNIEDLLPSSDSHPKDWTDDQADLMFLFNLLAQEKKGKPSGFVDDLIIKAFGGDRKSMHDVYELHHTSLDDKGTRDRLNRFIPLK